MSETLVALVQPSSGLRLPHAGAKEAFLRPTKRNVKRVELKQGTSMLPRCFNMLLCEALNLAEDHPITHLAMIHDDVAPDLTQEGDRGWLDVLLDELERTGADMVSAVVPIKNLHGLTSTAVDDEGDPWVVRRLTLREVFTLPETFGAEDVPWNHRSGPLLANTGLWVAKWDWSWIGPFIDPERLGDGQSGFRFKNRIVRAPDGVWVGHDQPEDWHFAGQMACLGKKVLATRKVKLEHELPFFHNRSVWGDWATDYAALNYRRKWRGGERRKEMGWQFPADVDGWLSETEGRALADLANGKRVLEIGSYCGRSTVCLAQTAAEVCCVDPFDGRATDRPQDTLSLFLENLHRYGVLEKVTARQGTSSTVLPGLRERFDLAFIDGSHKLRDVLCDAELAASVLSPGGLLAFHDYRIRPGDHDGRWDPGVTMAVNNLVADGAKLLQVVGSIAVLEPPPVAA